MKMKGMRRYFLRNFYPRAFRPESLRNLLPLLIHNGWLVVGVNNEHFENRDFTAADALVAIGAIEPPQIYVSMSMNRAACTMEIRPGSLLPRKN